MEFNAINPMEGIKINTDFNTLYKANLNNLHNLDASQNSLDPLKGNIEYSVDKSGFPVATLPQDINSINDKELANDLQQLTAPSRISNNALNFNNSVQSLNSPDKLYNTFANALEDGITNLNTSQKTSESAVETFAAGGNIDIHSVMIASEKAHLSMQLAMQLRNKIVQAYQEVSRIQV